MLIKYVCGLFLNCDRSTFVLVPRYGSTASGITRVKKSKEQHDRYAVIYFSKAPLKNKVHSEEKESADLAER